MDIDVPRREQSRHPSESYRYRVRDDDSGEEFIVWNGYACKTEPGKDPSCPLKQPR